MLVAVGRWHHLVGIGRGDPRHQGRGLRITGDDRGEAIDHAGGVLESVQPKTGTSGLAIRTVTEEASIGKNRSDVTPVADGRVAERRVGTGVEPGGAKRDGEDHRKTDEDACSDDASPMHDVMITGEKPPLNPQ